MSHRSLKNKEWCCVTKVIDPLPRKILNCIYSQKLVCTKRFQGPPEYLLGSQVKYSFIRSVTLIHRIVAMYLSRAKCIVDVTYNDGGGSRSYLNVIILTPGVMRLRRKMKVYQTLESSLKKLFTYKIVPFNTHPLATHTHKI